MDPTRFIHGGFQNVIEMIEEIKIEESAYNHIKPIRLDV